MSQTAALPVPQHDVRVVGGELVVLQVHLTGVSRAADVSVCIEPPDTVEVCVPERYYLKLRLPVPIAPTADEVRFKAKTGRLTMTCSTLSSSDSGSSSGSEDTDNDDQAQLQADAPAAAAPEVATHAAHSHTQQPQREAAAATKRPAKDQQPQQEAAAAAPTAAEQKGNEQQDRDVQQRDQHHKPARSAGVTAAYSPAGPSTSSRSRPPANKPTSRPPRRQQQQAVSDDDDLRQSLAELPGAAVGWQGLDIVLRAIKQREPGPTLLELRAAYSRPHARTLLGCWCRLADWLSYCLLYLCVRVHNWARDFPRQHLPFGVLPVLLFMPLRWVALTVLMVPLVLIGLWQYAWVLPLWLGVGLCIAPLRNDMSPTIIWLLRAEGALATSEDTWKGAAKLYLASLTACAVGWLWGLLGGPWLLSGVMSSVWQVAAAVYAAVRYLVVHRHMAAVVAGGASTLTCFLADKAKSCNFALVMLQMMMTGVEVLAVASFVAALCFHKTVLALVSRRAVPGTSAAARQQQQLWLASRWWLSLLVGTGPLLFHMWVSRLDMWGAVDAVLGYAVPGGSATAQSAVVEGAYWKQHADMHLRDLQAALQAAAWLPAQVAAALVTSAQLLQALATAAASAAAAAVHVLPAPLAIALRCAAAPVKAVAGVVVAAGTEFTPVAMRVGLQGLLFVCKAVVTVVEFVCVMLVPLPALRALRGWACLGGQLLQADTQPSLLRCWTCAHFTQSVSTQLAVRHIGSSLPLRCFNVFELAWFGAVAWHKPDRTPTAAGDASGGGDRGAASRQARRQEAARQLKEAKAAARRRKARS